MIASMLIAAVPLAALADDVALKRLQIGQAASPLRIKELLQAPVGSGTDLTNLKGKVIVLEFWATWCAPCIAAIPHMNDLSSKAAKDTQFIAITDEPRQTVEPFLKKKPINSWIGLVDMGTFKSLGINGRPTTVIIDKKGKVVAITGPAEVSESQLLDAAAGRPLKIKNSIVPPDFTPSPEITSNTVLLTHVQKSTATATDWTNESGSTKDSIYFKKASARDLLINSFQMLPDRLVINGELPDGLYDAEVMAPGQSNEQKMDEMRDVIQKSLGLDAHWQDTDTEVYLLRASADTKSKLTPTASTGGSSSHFSDKDVKVINKSLSSLSTALEFVLAKPVIDETGISGSFDFSLTFAGKGVDGVRAPLSKLGLELEPARRSIKMLVVKSSTKDQAK